MALATQWRERRDSDIVRRAHEGETHEAIADEWEISPQRVGQILQRQGVTMARKQRKDLSALTGPQEKTLAAFARLEARLGRPPSLTEIGRALGVSAQTVAGSLAIIEGYGFVGKGRNGGPNGGRAWWRLTPAGRRHLGVCCPTCGAKP